MKNLLSILVIAIITTLCCSCRHTNSSGKQTKDTTISDNISTTFSDDTAKLGRLLNLSVYKPTSVKFKYTFIDNSGQNERLSAPGPSDSYLQAVLFFDSLTFIKLRTNYFNADYASPGFNRAQFNFDWLDKKIKDELLQSDTAYHGHPDFFLGTGKSGKLWFLNKKILLLKSSS